MSCFSIWRLIHVTVFSLDKVQHQSRKYFRLPFYAAARDITDLLQLTFIWGNVITPTTKPETEEEKRINVLRRAEVAKKSVKI